MESLSTCLSNQRRLRPMGFELWLLISISSIHILNRSVCQKKLIGKMSVSKLSLERHAHLSMLSSNLTFRWKGAFGVVTKGFLKLENGDVVACAIKTMKVGVRPHCIMHAHLANRRARLIATKRRLRRKPSWLLNSIIQTWWLC